MSFLLDFVPSQCGRRRFLLVRIYVVQWTKEITECGSYSLIFHWEFQNMRIPDHSTGDSGRSMACRVEVTGSLVLTQGFPSCFSPTKPLYLHVIESMQTRYILTTQRKGKQKGQRRDATSFTHTQSKRFRTLKRNPKFF